MNHQKAEVIDVIFRKPAATAPSAGGGLCCCVRVPVGATWTLAH
jgi:MFS family permease